jgi:hypothetical protein
MVRTLRPKVTWVILAPRAVTCWRAVMKTVNHTARIADSAREPLLATIA